MSKVVETRNLFIDTASTVAGESRSVIINLPQGVMNCKENQIMRLSLQTFSTYKNWYNVNQNNNQFYLLGQQVNGDIQSVKITLTPGEYQSWSDPEVGMNRAIFDAVDTALKAPPFSIVAPATTITRNDLTKIQQIVFDAPNAAGPTTFQAFKLVCFTLPNYRSTTAGLISNIIGADSNSAFQDSNQILGGCPQTKQDGTATFATLTSLFNVTSVVGATDTKYTMRGYFPAQLTSTKNIYLRSNLNSTSFQTSGLDSAAGDFPYVVSSQILAKIPYPIQRFADYTRTAIRTTGTIGGDAVDTLGNGETEAERPYEIIEWIDNGNNVYSQFLLAKKINTLQLSITDSLGRLLPAVSPEQVGCNQLNFTCTLRIDVME